nr:restriction endonuclease subunit S [Lactiplantibacillus plantarum]
MKDNQTKYPQLRFKGFTDPWEERKLSDISNVTKLAGFEFTKYVRYQESGKIIALRGLNVKNGKLVLDEVKYIDDSDFSKLNRSKLYKNDILLTYVGTVGELAIVPENDKYYLAPNVARIRLQDHVNSIFVCQMMNDSNFYNRIISPLIATSSQPALSMENVRKFQLLMPDYQEQEKIGSFFKQLDDTIALHQRKLAKLKELKQGYLQKLFPQNGSKFPQLRFAGFADAWEERKLSSGLREYTDRVIVEDDKEYYQISVRNNFGGITLRGSKMGNKIGRKRQAKINLTKYPQTLIFTRQTVEQGGIGWVDKYCDGAIVTENMPTISLDTSVFSVLLQSFK